MSKAAKNDDDRQLWNCKTFFKFLCPKTWEKLKPTDDERVRYCSACDENVYLCTSGKEFEEMKEDGKCVAIPPLLTKSFAFGAYLGMLSNENKAQKEIAKTFWAEVEKCEKERKTDSNS